MFGVWSFLRQFMYTKFIVVTDDDVDIRDWNDVVWAITTRMDPVRDTVLVDHTPIDYLDFASPVPRPGRQDGPGRDEQVAGRDRARVGPADPPRPGRRGAGRKRPGRRRGRQADLISVRCASRRRATAPAWRQEQGLARSLRRRPTRPRTSVRCSPPAVPRTCRSGRRAPAPHSCRASSAPRACPIARLSRSMVCAWPSSASTVFPACVPVALPFDLNASSAPCQGPCSVPVDWLALVTAPKKTSSIFSRLASASLSGFSVSDDAAAHELLERLAVRLDRLQQCRVDAGERLAEHALRRRAAAPGSARCPSTPPRRRS